MINRVSVNARQGWWLCGFAAVCFGLATPATKLLVGDAGPFILAGLLYLGAAIAVAPLRVREQRRTTNRKQRTLLFLTVLVGGGIAPVLLMTGLHRASASTVSLLLNFELIATACVGRLFLREQIGRRAWLGISIVCAGGLVLTGIAGAGLEIGALFVIAACVCWGVDNAITASLDAYSPVSVTFAKGLFAGSANLAIGLMLENAPSLKTVIVAFLIGSIGYGLSITLWISGARLVGAARGQVIFALAPFIGALAAWPLVGEQPTTRIVIAFGISLAGVVVVTTAKHAHEHMHGGIVHVHPIQADDVHHRADVIEMLDGGGHRHLTFSHAHEHLPDIHHRHMH